MGDRAAGADPRPAAPWALVRVTGPSMSPAVRSGDRLLVRRVRSADAVRPGNVVLARFPSRPDLLVVKRVRRAVPGGHWVEGDNPFVRDASRPTAPMLIAMSREGALQGFAPRVEPPTSALGDLPGIKTSGW